MKRIRALRDLSTDELQAKLSDLHREHFNLRIQKALGELENPSRLRLVRRDIARVLTLLRERRAAGAGKEG